MPARCKAKASLAADAVLRPPTHQAVGPGAYTRFLVAGLVRGHLAQLSYSYLEPAAGQAATRDSEEAGQLDFDDFDLGTISISDSDSPLP